MTLYPALKASVPKALVLTAATVLAGCGFQLRGTSPVPAALQPLAVDCPASLPGDFCNSVREQLRLGGVELASEARADYVLRLRDYRQDRRASAITSTASAAEYVLRHTVSLELMTSEQVPLIGKTDLNASESYRYDENNVLAKQREEDELRQQLGDRLAQQVIFRLAPMTRERIDAAIAEYNASQKTDNGS
ncbi:LPS-assembly lipoprotein LptE [Marinobacter persicus]|jgi:LPS-assembly lipoprotein|uniref:LPS-assembly lipoprotein LptE n=1 Tax=Marinobacter persicus TaxID=930118 RepID=A0A2S6G9D0_9GAMM|nr:LPS assembly lipoprotein LptE [Marinobacter persicus]PPK53001.1 LPS-assembly lipoprotein [Marinobacter persicus]PPK55878.1 LPS-assembly lipoprotein [Marinobacter persicus]PPK59473.1 LPS-assembly lipoprotein [Marinobacter persicus]